MKAISLSAHIKASCVDSTAAGLGAMRPACALGLGLDSGSGLHWHPFLLLGFEARRRYNYTVLSQIIIIISTVLYFFNVHVPPPRAVNGDVPLLETVPLLFQPHFRGMLPCQIHVRHTHFRGFSPVPLLIQPLSLSRRGLDSAVLPSYSCRNL